MAELSAQDRLLVYSTWIDFVSRNRQAIAGLSKAELRAAVNAMDTWIDDNQASFNSALPTAARTSLTTKQKVRIFIEVIRKRWEVT